MMMQKSYKPILKNDPETLSYATALDTFYRSKDNSILILFTSKEVRHKIAQVLPHEYAEKLLDAVLCSFNDLKKDVTFLGLEPDKQVEHRLAAISKCIQLLELGIQEYKKNELSKF